MLPSRPLVLIALTFATASSAQDDPRYHWTADEIRLTAHLPADLPSEDVTRVVDKAASTWNAVGAGPAFVTEVVKDSEIMPATVLDGQNAIVFVTDDWPFEPGKLAATVPYYRARNHELVEIDVAFNAAAFQFAIDATDSDTFDFENVLTHELGHALGLGHLDGAPDATMFPRIDPAERNKRDLTIDDEDALLALYEQLTDGTAAGCSATAQDPSWCLALGALAFFLLRRLRPSPSPLTPEGCSR